MRVGHFELCIVNGLESPGGAEVQLRHGQMYEIALTNHDTRRCDASVQIDGKAVGRLRVPAGKTIVLERPTHQDGRFTFFRLSSPEAQSAKLSDSPRVGWIVAEFIPEARSKGTLFAATPEPVGEDGQPIADGMAGGTALVGKSEQTFSEADDIFSFDHEAAVTLELRLKCQPHTGSLFGDDEPFDLRGEAASDPAKVAIALERARGEIRRKVLMQEIEILSAAADNAAKEEFDFAKARKFDNLRYEKHRELDRLNWQNLHSAHLVTCPNCSCQFVHPIQTQQK